MFTIICRCADTLHMWCRCLAHMVRRVNTTCAEGKIHYDIRMIGDELWAKCCSTKNKQEVCRSLFSSNSFILCRLIRLHLFSHKAIKHRNAGKEKQFTHTIRYRTKKSHNSYTELWDFLFKDKHGSRLNNHCQLLMTNQQTLPWWTHGSNERC